jgi:hypothetical protein
VAWLLVVKELWLTLVEEEVPDLTPVGGEWPHDGDRRCIMGWAVKRGGLKQKCYSLSEKG